MKDMIIIGGGPAGLTAAIYGVRAGLDLVLLERLSPGGQVVNTWEVENYPGFAQPVPGWELMAGMESQARRLGVAIESGDVVSLARAGDGRLVLSMNGGGAMEARSVIAASGASFRKLGVPGENEHLGRGVSYCATCDGAFFKGKVTAVVGGGNTALEEAFFLTRFASKVYIIHRRDQFRGERILQERVLSCAAVEPVYSSTVCSVNGGEKVESVTLLDRVTGKESLLPLDGLFVFVGVDPNTAYLPKELLNDRGEVEVDIQMRTRWAGLYAAGDLRSHSKRQIVMAAADGATAAMEAGEYLASGC
ncbi:MAG: FAD-dependent oxidoreductase [Spirochaetes bacterium]|nr:FAD-dependent oxidoreductase [Spirochaetota bacterium]